MTKQLLPRGIYPVWIVAAELLVLLGFYLVTEDGGRGPVAWLNLAVWLLIVLMDTSGVLFLAHTEGEFSTRIPSLGILWFLDLSYTAVSLAVMVWGAWWSIDFRFQLLAHLVVLLAAAGVLITAAQANEHAVGTAVREAQLLGGVDALRERLNALALRLSCTSPPTAASALAGRCRDDVRYMAPSGNRKAVDLESLIQCKMDEVETLLVSHGEDSSGLMKLLGELSFLIRQLKDQGAA
ncbi:MAG: hypothetical protein SGI92_25295 [Bryobacteraceae bacterium]|nr:hypothetical protein [Bryobacteraceae bacterium]